jgi:hypothetical protein
MKSRKGWACTPRSHDVDTNTGALQPNTALQADLAAPSLPTFFGCDYGVVIMEPPIEIEDACYPGDVPFVVKTRRVY